MLKEDNVRKGFFEHAEFLALRDALPSYLKGFATFGYRTGWRISEISNLTWNQIDRFNGIVRIEPGESKNDEGRTIYLDDELKEVINHQWKLRKKGKMTPYVFPNRWGTGQIGKISYSWNKAFKKVGIGKRYFHDFRRTAVRNMVHGGVPERVAMMISGYKSRSVFEQYNIVSDDDLKRAAEKQATYSWHTSSYMNFLGTSEAHKTWHLVRVRS